MRIVGAAGVPAGAVLDTGDLLGEPSFETRGIIQTMQHPRGPHEDADLPGALRRRAAPRSRPRRCSGEHTRNVLGDWLGMSEDDVEALKRDRVV